MPRSAEHRSAQGHRDRRVSRGAVLGPQAAQEGNWRSAGRSVFYAL